MSRMVRWATGGKVSHSLVTYWDAVAGCHMLIQAESRGVVAQPAYRCLQYLSRSIHTVQRLCVPMETEAAFVRGLLRSTGAQYDWLLGLYWLAPGIGNRLARRDKYRPPWNPRARRNCSETIAVALMAAGIAPKGLGAYAHPDQLRRALATSDVVEDEPVSLLLELTARDAQEALGATA